MVKVEEKWVEINKDQGLAEVVFAQNAGNEFLISREFLAMKSVALNAEQKWSERDRLDNEISENFKQYLERKALYKNFGYDIDQERGFVLERAKPVLGKILEAGTGKGHFALALAKAGYFFVTFDISDQEQHFARLNIAHFGFEKQVDFRIENGERTSFADGSFDTIFSVNVLHHLSRPYQVVDEFARVLSPQGKIVLADFTKKGFDMMEKIHGLQGNMHEVGQVTLDEIKKYLSKQCFVINEAQTLYQRVLVASREKSLIYDYFSC